MSDFIKFFNELSIKDVPLVGGKNASLGEMYCQLDKKGVRVPNGFATTSVAYDYFMEEAGLKKKIRKILDGLDTHNMVDLSRRGARVRQTILRAEFPDDLKNEIIQAYKKLSSEYKTKNLDVAVRSSATAEDLPDASFAGQQETYLNIKGEEELLIAVKKCIASLFTNRAISYRTDKGFDHFKIALSVGVQKMIRSDLAASGVMFTIDTESGFRNAVLINSIYGLGENIVQGKVSPDEFYVFKPTMAILKRKIGQKDIKMIYSKNPKKPTRDVKVPKGEQEKQSITDEQVLELARWAIIIEKHYKRPMDIEWALDGREKQLYIIQARPETIHSVRDLDVLEEYKLQKRSEVIVSGQSVGSKIGAGVANKIMDIRDIKKFKPGQVLVTDMTDPDWEPIMKIASAIVTDKGGRTCFEGDTYILTNEGFVKIKDITKNKIKKGIYTLSLNRETLQLEWKRIIDSMSRQSQTIKINISQSGRHSDNYLQVTPDHKFIIWNNRTLVDKEINKIIKEKDFVLSVNKIYSFDEMNNISKELAYLWGCIYTDGSVYLSKTHGEVQFIQKKTKDKEVLIRTVKRYFKKLFNKEMCEYTKLSNSSQIIRGKAVKGSATAFRCYSKEVAQKFVKWKEELAFNMLNCSPKINCYFLAGVIDGDGTYSRQSNRVNIFCSNENFLQAIVISCLKLGILPQVTNNRNIYNIQIVDNLDKIFKYTKRVKGKINKRVIGINFLSAQQLFADIVDLVNFKGRIKTYVNRNLLIDKNKIKENVIPLLRGKIKKIVLEILNSDLVSVRAIKSGTIKKERVYNITVEGNHNYLVFSSKYMPVVVNNCHAAIVSRELGVPCVVGTKFASQKIKTGQKVTVSCAEGEDGFVYKGELPFKVDKVNIKNLERPKTKIMMNIGEPDFAFTKSFIPNDGVGLARLEFIINNYIKIHPLALLNFSKIKDTRTKKQINELTQGYKNKAEFFVDKLAEGVAMIAAAFYPKDVILRLSDFKSNEYANLIGGEEYEPVESNPMIGWRGASRYYSPKFLPAFELELKAIKRVRDEMGLTNLKVMIPFCRTIEEGKKVLSIMAKNGLKQGINGLEVYVMAEIPANIILADRFAEVFDGFSIGSNDLTQLTLGIDRDATGTLQVEGVSNEKNEAVKTLIKYLIEVGKRTKTKVGICGQAPSDFPDFTEFLVECGIDSISLIPDTIIKTTIAVAKKEKELKK